MTLWYGVFSFYTIKMANWYAFLRICNRPNLSFKWLWWRQISDDDISFSSFDAWFYLSSLSRSRKKCSKAWVYNVFFLCWILWFRTCEKKHRKSNSIHSIKFRINTTSNISEKNQGNTIKRTMSAKFVPQPCALFHRHVFFFLGSSLIHVVHVTGCKWQLKNRIRHKNDGASNRSGGCFAPDFLSYGKFEIPSSFHFNKIIKYLHIGIRRKHIREQNAEMSKSKHHSHIDDDARNMSMCLSFTRNSERCPMHRVDCHQCQCCNMGNLCCMLWSAVEATGCWRIRNQRCLQKY